MRQWRRRWRAGCEVISHRSCPRERASRVTFRESASDGTESPLSRGRADVCANAYFKQLRTISQRSGTRSCGFEHGSLSSHRVSRSKHRLDIEIASKSGPLPPSRGSFWAQKCERIYLDQKRLQCDTCSYIISEHCLRLYTLILRIHDYAPHFRWQQWSRIT